MSAVDVDITADHADGTGGGPLGGGLELMTRFTARITDPAVPYDITMEIVAFEGRLACERFELRRRGRGPVVIGNTLRTAVLDSYLGRIREELGRAGGATIVVKKDADTPSYVSYSSAQPDEWATFEAAQKRDRPIETAEVAELYREATASFDPAISRAPTAAIARRLGVHRGHAARLVGRARQEGLLGPAHRGRAGESEEPGDKQ